MKIKTKTGCILQPKSDDIAEQIIRHKPDWKRVDDAAAKGRKRAPYNTKKQ